jgi:23S rRNA U2552 (ribose-2'-O)-methylase RlmE/FtsJ
MCSAPGGWLQVIRLASEVGSFVSGVDLVGVRGIQAVMIMKEDIVVGRFSGIFRRASGMS